METKERCVTFNILTIKGNKHVKKALKMWCSFVAHTIFALDCSLGRCKN